MSNRTAKAKRKNAAPSRPSAKEGPARAAFPRDALWTAALIAAAVFVVYFPALQGGLVWDDAAHVTRPELGSLHGLWRIWFEPGATDRKSVV